MACLDVPIQTILGTECIGDSLPKIMGNFNILGDAACDLITKVNTLSTSGGTIITGLSSTIDARLVALSAAVDQDIASLSATVDAKFIPKPASASAQQVLTYDGSTTTWVASAAPGGGSLTLGTPQTATGQTSITFTGIPSTARRISVLFHGVTNNATVIFIRIGNGSVLTSGYTSICSYGGGAGNTSSSGFNMNSSSGSNVNNAYSGAVMIYCVSGFNYAANSAFCGYISEVMNGYITTSNYIDRVNISSSSAFNSGTINISYE